jgi:hypothetical protein
MSESTLRYEVRCFSLNHSVANISGINSIRRRALRLEMRRNVLLVPSCAQDLWTRPSSKTVTVQMVAEMILNVNRSCRKLSAFLRSICRAFLQLKLNLADIAVFGFILTCMASACRLVPAWISKIGAIGIVIAPLIAIVYLWNFDRYEG